MFFSCRSQERSINTTADKVKAIKTLGTITSDKDENQLMQVLRRIFQDTRGNMWFVGDRVFCYNGDLLIDLSENFAKSTIRQILEDPKGNIWFGTSEGLTKYNPSEDLKMNTDHFINFRHPNGWTLNDIWSMSLDRNGDIWLGSLGGVSRFDGENFSRFPLPESEPDRRRGVTSSKIVHHIMQDRNGHIWFGTNDGVYKYDPKIGIEEPSSLTHISELNGLCNNSINHILEDKKGNIWYATHFNGVCFWDGITYTQLTQDAGLNDAESWSLFEDSDGRIWFPVENSGVYQYDPQTKKLKQYYKSEGLPSGGIHAIFEDKSGMIWLSGFESLYRYGGESFIRITKNGPWK